MSWIGKSEDQRLEFKRPEALQHPVSVLRAVVAMLNAEGGTIVVGVEEKDGEATALVPVTDPQGAKRSLHDQILDRIEPRPAGVDVRVEGETLVVNVPRAAEGPYGLREGTSWSFWRRHGAVSRPLTYGELASRFSKRGKAEDPQHEAAQLALKKFRAEKPEDAPRLGVMVRSASRLSTPPSLESLRPLLEKRELTSSRSHGWTFHVHPYGPVEVARSTHLLRSGEKDIHNRRIEVRNDDDGTAVFDLRFWTERRTLLLHEINLDPQADPWLYPWALVEFTVSVFRLAGASIRISKIDGPMLCQVHLLGTKGLRLQRGEPHANRVPVFALMAKPASDPIEAGEILSGPTEVNARDLAESPDRVAHRMLRRVWGEFGLEEDQVGFWREEDGRFHFEP